MNRSQYTARKASAALLALALGGAGLGAGCGSSDDTKAVEVEVPASYVFKSRFDAKQSSVSYSGQTFRQALILTIDEFIGGLTDGIDSGELKPEPGDVRAILDSYYAFDSAVSGQEGMPITADLPLVQETFDELATGKDLKGKFAGNGGDVEHANWKTEFRGYAGVNSAELLPSDSSSFTMSWLILASASIR